MKNMDNMQEQIGHARTNSETIESKVNASARAWMFGPPQNSYVEAPCVGIECPHKKRKRATLLFALSAIWEPFETQQDGCLPGGFGEVPL